MIDVLAQHRIGSIPCWGGFCGKHSRKRWILIIRTNAKISAAMGDHLVIQPTADRCALRPAESVDPWRIVCAQIILNTRRRRRRRRPRRTSSSSSTSSVSQPEKGCAEKKTNYTVVCLFGRVSAQTKDTYMSIRWQIHIGWWRGE